MGSTKKIKQLVLDSGAFLRNIPIWEYGEEFYSVPEVMREIKDKNAKEFIQGLPCEIKLINPKPETIKFINDFTKQTGEYSSLSLVDVKILALTYDLEFIAKGGDDHLRKKPVQKKTEERVSSKPPPPQNVEGFYLPSSNLGSDEKSMDLKSSAITFEVNDELNTEDNTNAPEASELPLVKEISEAVDSLNISQENNTNEEDEEVSENGDEEDEEVSGKDSDEYDDDDENNNDYEDDDDGGGWITPSNIKSLKGKNDSVCEDDYKDVVVACMSGDFSIQNTLLHIGLKVIGVNGKLIKTLRMYMLKCFVCNTLCSDWAKLFCYKCGYKTLKKVPYTINPDGTKHIWHSNRPINKKGLKFSLPAPKGGKHAVNPILCADQRVPQMRASKRSLRKNDPLSQDFLASDTPFLARDVDSRAAKLGIVGINDIVHKVSKHRGTYYWEKKNPNDPGRNVKSRRKR